jgi:hypothetical protein
VTRIGEEALVFLDSQSPLPLTRRPGRSRYLGHHPRLRVTPAVRADWHWHARPVRLGRRKRGPAAGLPPHWHHGPKPPSHRRSGDGAAGHAGNGGGSASVSDPGVTDAGGPAEDSTTGSLIVPQPVRARCRAGHRDCDRPSRTAALPGWPSRPGPAAGPAAPAGRRPRACQCGAASHGVTGRLRHRSCCWRERRRYLRLSPG